MDFALTHFNKSVTSPLQVSSFTVYGEVTGCEMDFGITIGWLLRLVTAEGALAKKVTTVRLSPKTGENGNSRRIRRQSHFAATNCRTFLRQCGQGFRV